MSLIKRKLFYILLCVVLLFSCPLTKVSAAEDPYKDLIVESDFHMTIGYHHKGTIIIDKGGNSSESGGPVKTGDEFDLYNCFVLLSISTISLFLLIAFKNKKDREQEMEDMN